MEKKNVKEDPALNSDSENSERPRKWILGVLKKKFGTDLDRIWTGFGPDLGRIWNGFQKIQILREITKDFHFSKSVPNPF